MRPQRSTGDLLILMIAGTICASVLLSGFAVTAIELFYPDRDTTKVVAIISDVINTLIGLLAGYMAGRSHGYESGKSNRDDSA